MSDRIHGGIDPRELAQLGIERASLLDLSVNVNPFGPHPNVVRAIREASLHEYPDHLAGAARDALARAHDVELARVLVGHGSAELLWAAVSALRGVGPLLLVAPTFSEPEYAARAAGVPTIELRAQERDDFRIDPSALDRAIGAQRAAGVYLCQPNNPDGGMLALDALRALIAAHPRTCFILDQAFLSLSTRHADAAVRFGDNALLVRSMTKEHALPGLRIGYAIGAPAQIARLASLRPSWMVSAPAQAAIVAACAEPQHVAHARAFLLSAKVELERELTALGVPTLPSQTHFLLAKVGAADRLRERLLTRHRISIRSARSFGLPEHVRIAACAEPERARLIAALREALR